MKIRIYIFLSALCFAVILFGQNGHLSIGVKENGLCFGNSKNYNGIRFNFLDKNVSNINGFNLALQTKVLKIDGISVGLFASLDSVINGLQIGGLASVGDKLSGLSISPVLAIHEKINGIDISGFTWFKLTNGVQISLLGTLPMDYMYSRKINGLGIGGLVFVCEHVNGVSIASLISFADTLNGLSIACWNATNELHGFQFGLLNYAMNNKYPFKKMPLMNFNLRRKNKKTFGYEL